MLSNISVYYLTKEQAITNCNSYQNQARMRNNKIETLLRWQIFSEHVKGKMLFNYPQTSTYMRYDGSHKEVIDKKTFFSLTIDTTDKNNQNRTPRNKD